MRPSSAAARRFFRRMAGSSLVVLAAVSAGAVSSAAAQDAAGAGAASAADGSSPDEPIVLDTVTLTGARSAQRLSETARTLYVVDGKQLQARVRSGQTLQQALGQEVPSYDPASSTARTSYGQNLRGRTALVLIDGVSQNSARGLSRQFDSIDPFNIERVEVLSGATSLYGGNATGGIINIITKKGADAEPGLHGEIFAGAESGFQAGNDKDGKAAAAVTYKDELWDTRISIAANKTNAFYDGSGTILVPDITQTSLAFNDRLDILGSAGLQIDEGRRLELSAQYFDSGQNSDYGLYYGPNFAALRNPALFETRDGYASDVDPATNRVMLNGAYTDADVLGQELLLQGFYRTEKVDFNPFPASSPSFYFGASHQDTDYYGFKAALVARPLEGLRVTYGIDGDRDAFTSSQTVFDATIAGRTGGLDFQTFGETGLYPGIEVSTLAGFAEASYEATDALTLTGGVRYQFVDTVVDDFVGASQQISILFGRGASADAIPGGSISYDDALFNAGAIYRLDDRQNVYANFSQGFELPDPSRYYGLGSYQLTGTRYALLSSANVADSALQAIKTNSYEAGYRYADGLYSAEAVGYYSLSDKTITLSRTTLNINVLDQDRRVYGLEGKLGVQLPYGFDAGVNGHLVRTSFERNGDWIKGSVGDSSVSKLGGHLGWQGEALGVKLEGQHVFDLDDDAGYAIEGYTLVDLTGNYRFETADTTVNFGVLNLFDKDYTTVWGQRAKALYGALASEDIFDYKGRGRTFTLSVTKAF